MIYTSSCTESCQLVLMPVPGAVSWPRRLECTSHGYPTEASRRIGSLSEHTDFDKPNDYVTEIASPADVIEIGEDLVSQY